MKSRVATLQSIELAGFKSFAKRTKINFGTGLVAIVGPNGSGKSNITDAIKWVFGEQRSRSLRSEKSEDLIFHGGKEKSRASMAEVIIKLDNSSRAIPIDLNEIEITRRLYRSGESNYLLNNRRASLSSIQEVLAASGFGVGSYTVIGQGMIDKLILSSAKERKQLFEEASGIKQYEIKLSQTQKRINNTQHNVSEIDSLIAGLAPKHELLARQKEMLFKKNNLTKKLINSKAGFISSQMKELEKAKSTLTKSLLNKQKKLKNLVEELKNLEDSSGINNKSEKSPAESINTEISNLEKQKSKLELDISAKHSKLDDYIKKINELEFSNQSYLNDLRENEQSFLEHKKDLKKIESSVKKLDAKISEIDEKIKHQTKNLEDARKQLMKSQKSEYLKHSLGLIDILQDGIKRNKSEEELGIVFYKLRRMIKHSISDDSAEMATKVGKIQNVISRLLDDRENINEQQTNEVIKLRAIEMDSSNINQKIDELKTKIASNKNKDLLLKYRRSIAQLEKEIANLESVKESLINDISAKRDNLVELAQSTSESGINEYYEKHEKITNELTQVNSEINIFKSDLSHLENQLEEIKKTKALWFPYKTPKVKDFKNISMQDINLLEAELNLLQEINPEVEKEALEFNKRMIYLESQQVDLNKALNNLRKVADNTQKKMQLIFEKNFHKINDNFNKNFKELFGGGTAELILSKQNDEFGVEIYVKLPNKNSQNISSLSGGEKALASVALLSGILMANPSPFVVLDEVDAALDEENTKRFAGVISKITKHSQVLVVTHNHDTMSVADELLGVTTSGNNESSIIRVELSNYPIEALK